jgi:hypothetical protein
MGQGQMDALALCEKCLRGLKVDLAIDAAEVRSEKRQRVLAVFLVAIGCASPPLALVLILVSRGEVELWVVAACFLASYVLANVGKLLWRTAQRKDREQQHLKEYLWWRRNRQG